MTWALKCSNCKPVLSQWLQLRGTCNEYLKSASAAFCCQYKKSSSLSVVKSRVLGSVSSGSVVLYEVRVYPAS